MYELFETNKSIPFYIGIDPTADSLHVGTFCFTYGSKSSTKMWT